MELRIQPEEPLSLIHILDNVTASIGNRSETFSNVKRRYLLDLGYCVPGEIITLSTTDSETLSATAYVFNEEAFIPAYNELNSQPFVVTEMTDSCLLYTSPLPHHS